MKNFFLILLLFFSTSILANNKFDANDSLVNNLSNNVNQTLKIREMFRLVRNFQDSDPQKSFKYLEASKQQLLKSFFKEGWVEFLILKSREQNIVGNFERSFRFISAARRYATKHGLVKYYLEACCQESFLRTKLFGDKNSISFLSNVIKQHANSKYHNEIGDIYSALARFQQYSNQVVSSLANYKKALTLFRAANNERGIYTVYFKLCEIYILTNDKVNAVSYFRELKALKIKNKTNRDLYYELFLEGDLNFLLNKNDKAIDNYEAALVYNDKFKDNVYRFIILEKLNKYYLASGKTDKAVSFCLAEKRKSYDNPFLQYMLNINIAIAYYSKLDLKKAKFYYDKSFKLFNELNKEEATRLLEDEQIRFYRFAAKLEFSMKNYERAYKFNDLYIEKNEAYVAEQNTKRLQELQTLYDTHEKELKIKNISFLNQQKEVQIKNQRHNLVLISVVLFFLILIILILIWFFIKNRAFNKELLIKNQIIENNNKLLESSKNIILESVKEKDLLLKEIHHRVKNNLQLMISLLNIQARESLTNLPDFLAKSKSRIYSMALIHQNLYEMDNFKNVDFADYINNLIVNIEASFDRKAQVKVVTNIHNVFFDIQTSIPLGLIINELVTNSLKHAFPNDKTGSILVSLVGLAENEFELTVSDDGVGFSENYPIRKKTLGLELVELLALQLRASISVSSENGVSHKILFKVDTII